TLTDPVLAEHANAIRALGKQAIENVIEIGHRLTECRNHSQMKHGDWLPWLEREFGWSDQTARNFMQVYELAGKTQNFWNLSRPVSGIYWLAAPSTPESARDQIIKRAQASGRKRMGRISSAIAVAAGSREPAPLAHIKTRTATRS